MIYIINVTFQCLYLCLCSELIMKHGVHIRVLGDLELLPADVLESVARAIKFSKNNNRLINISLSLFP